MIKVKISGSAGAGARLAWYLENWLKFEGMQVVTIEGLKEQPEDLFQVDTPVEISIEEPSSPAPAPAKAEPFEHRCSFEMALAEIEDHLVEATDELCNAYDSLEEPEEHSYRAGLMAEALTEAKNKIDRMLASIDEEERLPVNACGLHVCCVCRHEKEEAADE